MTVLEEAFRILLDVQAAGGPFVSEHYAPSYFYHPHPALPLPYLPT